jgi:SAM-dependent methyltransferase
MSESDLLALYERLEKSQNNKSVGRGEAFVVAEAQTHILTSELDIAAANTVLDYGCGIGRTMPMLFEKTRRRLELDGCDISQEFIEECRKLYASYPFRFFKIFAENPHYTKYNTSKHEDSVPSEHYDLAYSFSVFTHLNLQMAEATLKRVHQYLKQGGIYYFTMFQIDEEAVGVINANKSPSFGFSNRTNVQAKEYFAHNSEPFAFVALGRAELEKIILDAGFEVQKFVPGGWRAIPVANSHDAYVVRKR